MPPQAWFFLILSTLLGLGLGDSLDFEAIKRIGVARAMPISMAYPVPAALGAVVLLHEPLGPLALLGVALTLGGVYLVAAPPRSTQPVDGYWRGVLLASVAARRLDVLDAAAAAAAATGRRADRERDPDADGQPVAVGHGGAGAACCRGASTCAVAHSWPSRPRAR